MLRLLPQITLRALQGGLWLLAVVWTNLFAFGRAVVGLLIRIGTLILRIPHSALVLLNRWGLQTRGAWRVLGAPVAILTGIVHELDIETDARLDQLLPEPADAPAAPHGRQANDSAKVFA